MQAKKYCICNIFKKIYYVFCDALVEFYKKFTFILESLIGSYC